MSIKNRKCSIDIPRPWDRRLVALGICRAWINLGAPLGSSNS